jgi:hypothetical protein
MLPNFVLAGAPRCGTTSFFAWLADHSEVCGARVKETGFFLDPDDPDFRHDLNYRDHGLGAYKGYFDHCGEEGAKIVIEATPDYLYQNTAPRVLSSLEDPPQIMFLLRKPSDRAYSHFTFLRDSILVLDAGMSFGEYVTRLKQDDPTIPAAGHARRAIAHSRYSEYLNEWVDRFGRDHLHFFLFEGLTKDSRAFMKEVAREIGIDPRFYDSYEFSQQNPTIQVRSRWVHGGRRWLGRRLPASIRDLLKRATAKPYARMNVRPAAIPTAEDSAALADLDREFAPYNERLARKFDLDLSVWR